jgi:hypothetical protein
MEARRRRSAPYAAAVVLTAEAVYPNEPEPPATYEPWLKPIGTYGRRLTTIVEGSRYG